MTPKAPLDKKTLAQGRKAIGAALRAFTLAEAACLLDLPVETLRDKTKRGEIKSYMVTTWPKYPWVGHAYRRRRLYIRGSELERWMRGQEEAYSQKQREAKTKGRPG